MLHISVFRLIGRGHAQRVLRKNRAPYHNRYDRIVGDQRERLDSILRKIKYEKDAVAKALDDTQLQLANVFSIEEAQRLLESHEAVTNNDTEPSTHSRAEINEAYRLHRLLRPDAPNFFEVCCCDCNLTSAKEQSFISMKHRLDSVINDHSTDCFKQIIPTDLSLDPSAPGEPGLSDDAEVKEIHLTNWYLALLDFVGLKRDSSNVTHWANSVWPKLKPFLANDFSAISSKEIESWLISHLDRVRHNRGVLKRPNLSEWYDIKRDLPYDGVPYPDALLDERRVGYPLDKAASYLMGLLQLFDKSLVGDIKKECLEGFVKALRKIGLKDWFGVSEGNILSTFFGRSCMEDSATSDVVGRLDSLNMNGQVSALSANLLNMFSKGMEHELESDSLSPSKVFSHLDNRGRKDGLNALDSDRSALLSDADIDTIITEYVQRLGKVSESKVAREYNTVFDRMIEEELEFHSSVGAGKVNEGGIDYKVPAGAQFDAKRNYYVRTREGVDPTLKLENLRSCVLERRRMRTMTKEGRVYFLRVVAAVGDGKGYFGTGVGFGNDIATARGSAVQQALRHMYFIDYDSKEPLTTPVLGQEYGSRVYITPRKMGSGIKTNRKYLPLVYLTGLDNCKVSFHGRSSWLTRAKALRKALEQIYSRRTMCNATGMKYVYVDKPGDHTVHWPDRWFIPLSKEYKDKIASLKNLKRAHFRRHCNRVVLPEEVIPEIPNYARHKFRSPLELREQERKRLAYISTKISVTAEPPKVNSIEPIS
ncbi:hypothetical protein X943_003794 [Babesia divergens]|uniref:S5 DRBM domain-containing protein n=1 Tax=Babesia divergens TaxID=32595 RepID=A0AAD9LKC0_BABDI|nr:hypothetical protein X943_003794 [Babesia divergens]